jgi:hypothetical protein
MVSARPGFALLPNLFLAFRGKRVEKTEQEPRDFGGYFVDQNALRLHGLEEEPMEGLGEGGVAGWEDVDASRRHEQGEGVHCGDTTSHSLDSFASFCPGFSASFLGLSREKVQEGPKRPEGGGGGGGGREGGREGGRLCEKGVFECSSKSMVMAPLEEEGGEGDGRGRGGGSDGRRSDP